MRSRFLFNNTVFLPNRVIVTRASLMFLKKYMPESVYVSKLQTCQLPWKFDVLKTFLRILTLYFLSSFFALVFEQAPKQSIGVQNWSRDVIREKGLEGRNALGLRLQISCPPCIKPRGTTQWLLLLLLTSKNKIHSLSGLIECMFGRN